MTCCERSLQLIQYIFPEISQRCCEEIFELFNYDLYHTIFYIRHNYYIFASCHSNGQNTQQDKISPQPVNQEFTSNYQISPATWDSSSITSSIFTDSSDDNEL